MHDFALHSTWNIPADVAAVWAALRKVRLWPAWWPYVKGVTELTAGHANGIGAMTRFHRATRLLYRIDIDIRTTAMAAGEQGLTGYLRG
jgi:hypothetical protein